MFLSFDTLHWHETERYEQDFWVYGTYNLHKILLLLVVLNLGLVVGLGILLFDLKDPFAKIGGDDAEGNDFDDLFAETVVVIFEDGTSFEVVSFPFDISVVASLDVS